MSCASIPTSETTRSYAEEYGCWPYGRYQPPTPTSVSTPLNAQTPQPAPSTPVIAYPECPPAAGTPTKTPTPIPQETPQRGPELGEYVEIGATAGKNTNGTLASNGIYTAIGWIAWGAGPDEYVADVWVRVLGPNTQDYAQSVNTFPVKKGAGGLGLAVLPDNSIIAVFGAGGYEGNSHIYQSVSTDAGKTWSTPEALSVIAGADEVDEAAPTPIPENQAPDGLDTGGGGVQSLVVDTDGGLHLLFLARDPFRLGYAYRPVTATQWHTIDRITDGSQIRGAMAILPHGEGYRRFVLAPQHETSELRILSSDDGVVWTSRILETNRYIRPEVITSLSVLAARRPDGSALVAAAWGQYSKGGVFASISLDGGVYWSEEEPIALHQNGGVCYAEDGSGLPCGYQPSLAYDPTTDRLAVAWVEIWRGQEPSQQTRLAVRVLTPLEPWRFAITPDNAQVMTPPIVANWGNVGTLVSDPTHRNHWLLTWDTRNRQYRIYAREVNLSALLKEGIS